MKYTKSKKYENVYWYKNKNGKRWSFRLRYYDANKKRREIKRTNFDTEREAFSAMIEMQHAINENDYNKIEPNKITVSEWFLKHIEYNKPNDKGDGVWALSTYETNENIYRNYVSKVLGNIKLSDFDLNLYEEVYLKHVKDLSPNSIATHHRYINSSMNAAVRRGIITNNPIRFARLPKINDEEEDKFITDEELGKVLDYVYHNENHTTIQMVFTLALTGMRVNEARALKWKNIDYEKCQIQVYNQMHNYHIGPTKGRKKRIIKVDPELINMFKVYRKWCIERTFKKGDSLTDDHFVFISYNTGELVKREYCYNCLRSVSKKLKCKVTPHTFRHTHATILLMNGEPLETVAKRLGNTPQILLQHYSHVLPSSTDKSVTTFSRKIGFGARTGAK